MTVKLPNEVILHISRSLGTDSSLDLKPFALLDRQWHSIIAPILLSTIAVSSLGELIELCDQIISFSEHTGGTLLSTIEAHTKTLVVAGETWDAWKMDSHLGLEDLGDIPRGDDEDGDEIAEPDTEMLPRDILVKLHDALPRLIVLEGFEWYGRFAGDYYLARYLQNANVIKQLAYGIDMQCTTPSIAYRQNAFLFEGLKSLSVTTEYEPEPDMLPYTFAMMHRNPDLESILFDCKFAESLSGTWSLVDLICDTSKPENPIFVWPNLTRLVLRFYKGAFWHEAEEVDKLAKFLVAHPKIETLVLHETCLEGSDSETAFPLSLSSHPDALPHLRILVGSPRLLAGVLESRAASSSVLSVVDNSEELFDSDGAKAPFVDRILTALENAPDNRVWRLTLEVPQLSRVVYARFARVIPRVRFLEFLKPNDGSRRSTTPQDDSFDPLVDIPAGLSGFSQLGTIGEHIVQDFISKADGSDEEKLLELAKRVPKIETVHCGDGVLLRITRDSDGSPGLSKEIEYTDNEEYDWATFEVDWRHRPMSNRTLRKIRGEETPAVGSLIYLVKN